VCGPGGARVRSAVTPDTLCNLVLPSLAAGRYRAMVTVMGNGVAAQETNGDFSLRYPGWLAFVIIAGGILFGGRVGGWQKDGRRRAVQSLAAARLGEQFDGLVSTGLSKTSEVIAVLTAELAAMRAVLESDRAADFDARLKLLAGRPALAQRFADIEARHNALNRPAAAVTTARNAAAAALTGAETDAAAKAALDDYAALVASNGMAVAAAPGGVVDAVAVPSRWPAWMLETWILRTDTVITTVLVILAALIGVTTLWSGNPAWGSLKDVIIAFLAGAGLGLGGTLSLEQLSAPKPLGTIPTLV
jgi:hypothetical protein